MTKPTLTDAECNAIVRKVFSGDINSTEGERQMIRAGYERGYAAGLAAGDKWREAVINELVVAHIYNKAHDDDPRKAIQDAITWNCQVALDPLVSSDAQALVDRGLAAGAGVRRVETKPLNDWDDAAPRAQAGSTDTPEKGSQYGQRVAGSGPQETSREVPKCGDRTPTCEASGGGGAMESPPQSPVPPSTPIASPPAALRVDWSPPNTHVAKSPAAAPADDYPTMAHIAGASMRGQSTIGYQGDELFAEAIRAYHAIAALRAENARLTRERDQAHRNGIAEAERQYDRAERAEAALAAAQADAKRLEWMQTHLLRSDASMRFADGTFKTVNAWSIASARTDLREAIDAARAKSAQK